MGEVERIAGLKEALDQYDAAVKECPANTTFLGKKLCPKCDAGPDEGCRKEILRALGVVRAVRTHLKGETNG